MAKNPCRYLASGYLIKEPWVTEEEMGAKVIALGLTVTSPHICV